MFTESVSPGLELSCQGHIRPLVLRGHQLFMTFSIEFKVMLCLVMPCFYITCLRRPDPQKHGDLSLVYFSFAGGNRKITWSSRDLALGLSTIGGIILYTVHMPIAKHPSDIISKNDSNRPRTHSSKTHLQLTNVLKHLSVQQGSFLTWGIYFCV